MNKVMKYWLVFAWILIGCLLAVIAWIGIRAAYSGQAWEENCRARGGHVAGEGDTIFCLTDDGRILDVR